MSRQAKRQDIAEELPLQVGDYRLEKVIGQGTYGKVRLGSHIETGENAAIKVIEKAQIQSPKQVARLQREIRFLKLLNHPNIVKVLDVIETQEFIYIIMECAVGGELFDYIVANKRVKENEARSFFRMVLSAVDYCHQNAIIHRDLKPENLLLDDKKTIKIIDFGFGNNFSHTGLLDTFCGSPFYAAPEMILGKKYEGPEVDMWSLGVILFALLCGHLPFDDDNMKELYKKIANGTYKTPDYLPSGARHLISRLITVDPKKRATLKEALQHPWVNDGYDGPPQSFVPKRPIITDPNSLSKDITNRLEIFGYTKDAIRKAFSPGQDSSKPNAIRATYFLLSEMVTREQARLRALRKLQQQRLTEKIILSNSNSSFQTLDAPDGRTGKSDEDVMMTSSSTIESSACVSSNYPQAQNNNVNQNLGYTRTEIRKRIPQTTSVFVPERPKTAGSLISDSEASPFGSLRNIDGESSASRVVSCSSGVQQPRDSLTTIQYDSSSRPSTISTQIHRRQSVPIMIPTPSFKMASPAEKLKEELRGVSGWFLNFSTTTGKSQQDILGQFFALLGEQAVSWSPEGKAMFQSIVDISVVSEKMEGSPSSPSATKSKSSQTVGFQVEILRIPRTNLNAIHFKRLSGGVWSYKKICNKILSKLCL